MKKKQRSIPVQYVIPQTMVDQLPNMYFEFTSARFLFVSEVSKGVFFIKVQRKEGKTTLQEIVN